MLWFWWQQLPLLIIFQLLDSWRLSHKLPSFTVSSLSAGTRTINLSPSFTTPSTLHISTQLEAKLYGLRKVRIAGTVDEVTSIPIHTRQQASKVKKPSKQKVGATFGGIISALLLVVAGVLVYMCLMCLKRSRRRESDMKSSVASSPFELERKNSSPHAGALSTYDTQNLRQFTILELGHATSNFNKINIMGEGIFGLVYKGLLDDGSLVAVKRHLHQPIQHFVNEVKHIAQVDHRHVVKLIGYCEENYEQLLVYDFLHNGNVGNHLYDGKGLPIGELDMSQRLLIALGAAKGIEHLHGLVPPVLHMHFRTRNVLLDEQFTAKVSDFGLSKLLADDNYASSSSAFDCFLDPELRSLKDFSERSDVYSFGVFLLELISGCEAVGRNQSDLLDNLVLQAKSIDVLYDFIDKTAKDRTTNTAKQMMELALMCVDTSAKRPAMKNVVAELERIQESVVGHLQPERREDISVVTLGSDLFK